MGTVEISRTPSAPTQPLPLPPAGSPHQRSAFATSDGPIGSHPKSTLYLRGHPQCVHSLRLDRCAMTRTHNSSTQKSFTALKIRCALPPPPPSPQPLAAAHLSRSPPCALPRASQSVPELGSCSLRVPFQTGVFHSGIGLYRSSRAFHGLIAHVFLALTIFRCLNALQFMHPLSQ